MIIQLKYFFRKDHIGLNLKIAGICMQWCLHQFLWSRWLLCARLNVIIIIDTWSPSFFPIFGVCTTDKVKLRHVCKCWTVNLLRLYCAFIWQYFLLYHPVSPIFVKYECYCHSSVQTNCLSVCFIFLLLLFHGIYWANKKKMPRQRTNHRSKLSHALLSLLFRFALR